MLIIFSFCVGSIIGLIFGYKVGKFAGQRQPKKSKSKLSFEQMLQQTLHPSKMNDSLLAAEVDASIEAKLGALDD